MNIPQTWKTLLKILALLIGIQLLRIASKALVFSFVERTVWTDTLCSAGVGCCVRAAAVALEKRVRSLFCSIWSSILLAVEPSFHWSRFGGAFSFSSPIVQHSAKKNSK